MIGDASKPRTSIRGRFKTGCGRSCPIFPGVEPLASGYSRLRAPKDRSADITVRSMSVNHFAPTSDGLSAN